MPNTINKILATLLLCILTACAQNPSPTSGLASIDVVNIREPEAQVLSSGQPTPEQFRQLAASGVKHVINLRPAAEQTDLNEAELVESLGMSYHSIPVAGIADVTTEKAATLDQLLQTLEGPLLVHCASGNRVGALRAVTAMENGLSVDAALEEGSRWGLSGMTPAVRGVLTD